MLKTVESLLMTFLLLFIVRLIKQVPEKFEEEFNEYLISQDRSEIIIG